MEEFDYKPASHKYREAQTKSKTEEKRNITKVVKNPAKTKKKSELAKLSDVFISEDAKNVKSYILMDVLIPAAKKAISDIVRDGIDMILYGETGRSSSGRRSGDYVQYGRFSDPRDRRPRTDSRPRSRFDYDDIAFETRGEAERALDQMYGIIKDYGFATVSDLYEMADITAPYTANKYGWMSVDTAKIRRTRDGDYVLDLPKAMAID